MATDIVADGLRVLAKAYESEAATTAKVLAEHNFTIEAKVVAIADLDRALGTLTRSNNPAFAAVIAYLRGQRNNTLSELGTAQTQVSQTQATYDNHVKMRDAFTAAADLLAPAAPVETRVTTTSKGK